MHLGMSYWSFALMGLHLGLHMPGMTAEVKKNKKISIALFLLFAIASGIGLYFIISKKIVEYLLFQTHFAFLDYDRSAISVFLENISMLLFFSFIGNCSAILCQRKIKADRSNLLLILSILLAILIGVMPSLHVSKKDNFQFDSSSSSFENDIYSSKGDMSNKDIDDGFILLEGGVFEMGSPESENWRIDDEEKHSVAISSFYISPYEATQEEYFKLAGSNPSYFKGDILPVENVSWIDAIHFANQYGTKKAQMQDLSLLILLIMIMSSGIWKQTATDCRQKLSGNMPAEQEAILHLIQKSLLMQRMLISMVIILMR